jgi:hypothetical protein
MLQAGQQPGRQRAGRERAAVRVPVRDRVQHLAFQAVSRRCGAGAHPGHQPQLRRIWQQLGHRQVAQGADRQAQPEQGGAAADQHFPAGRVGPQLVRADCNSLPIRGP